MSMSSIARKRRSEVQTQPQTQAPSYNPNILPQQQQQQQQKPMGTGLTLPQVISVIDNRLIHLENFMKETNSAEKMDYASLPPAEISPEFVEEVQTRFDILAREISDLKDVVLKLQSFTMDVNKSLLEERIHILSDLGEKNAVEDI
jgi:hypothetical protein